MGLGQLTLTLMCDVYWFSREVLSNTVSKFWSQVDELLDTSMD